MTDAELERWGNWLAAALGLTNPEASGRVMGIFVPLARRLHARTGATAEQAARRVLKIQHSHAAYRVRVFAAQTGRQTRHGSVSDPEGGAVLNKPRIA